MTLTLSHGPLSGNPAETNYRIEGPAHRLFFEAFPRRVCAMFTGETILDTRRGKLLHETGLLPQLYVPREDVRLDLCEATDHGTHCPFKGDASYWSVAAGDRTAQDAVWAYLAPMPASEWLTGYVAPYWSAMDAWFDEDEEVRGHLRDPYHRVDAVPTSGLVRVVARGETVAETRRAMLVSETGLPNRYYVPADDVRRELLEPSATHTECPYKGTASYRSLPAIADAAWFYPEPFDGVRSIAGYFCFSANGVETSVEGAATE